MIFLLARKGELVFWVPPHRKELVFETFRGVCVSVCVKKDCLLFGFAPSGFGPPWFRSWVVPSSVARAWRGACGLPSLSPSGVSHVLRFLCFLSASRWCCFFCGCSCSFLCFGFRASCSVVFCCGRGGCVPFWCGLGVCGLLGWFGSCVSSFVRFPCAWSSCSCGCRVLPSLCSGWLFRPLLLCVWLLA